MLPNSIPSSRTSFKSASFSAENLSAKSVAGISTIVPGSSGFVGASGFTGASGFSGVSGLAGVLGFVLSPAPLLLPVPLLLELLLSSDSVPLDVSNSDVSFVSSVISGEMIGLLQDAKHDAKSKITKINDKIFFIIIVFLSRVYYLITPYSKI